VRHFRPFFALPLLMLSAAIAIAASDPPGSTGAPGPAAPASAAPAAPDFQYRAMDGRWRHLHDLRTSHGVLVVFEPTDAQLVALESERDSLARAGVLPVAILRRSESKCWSVIERLGLTFSLMSDPRGDLARDFQVAERQAPATAPAWFLVDRTGAVRGMERGGLPAGTFAAAVASALSPSTTAGALPDPRP